MTPASLAGLVRLVESRDLGFGTAKDRVFPALLAGEVSAEAVVRREGLAQVGDPGIVQALVDQILAANPGPVAQIRSGKESLKGFLVGQVLKAGQGRLDAKQVTKVLADTLAKG